MKRLLEATVAAVALTALTPMFLLIAILIRLTSPGPILYTATRVGLHGRLFTLYKFRTMQAAGSDTSTITAHGDPRVFPIGAWLRRLKLDELPQLFNVIRGDMSVIGPRPEVPWIVNEHYTPIQYETLCVRPGLASPGSIYYYTHGEQMLTGNDPEQLYVNRLLTTKLALDVVYVREASFLYDLRIAGRTVAVVAARCFGRRSFPQPPEMKKAVVLESLQS